MDIYERTIVDLATRYGGGIFYDYHRMFAAQASAYAQKGIILDWGSIDTKIYTGLRVIILEHVLSARV